MCTVANPRPKMALGYLVTVGHFPFTVGHGLGGLGEI